MVRKMRTLAPMEVRPLLRGRAVGILIPSLGCLRRMIRMLASGSAVLATKASAMRIVILSANYTLRGQCGGMVVRVVSDHALRGSSGDREPCTFVSRTLPVIRLAQCAFVPLISGS